MTTHEAVDYLEKYGYLQRGGWEAAAYANDKHYGGIYVVTPIDAITPAYEYMTAREAVCMMREKGLPQ